MRHGMRHLCFTALPKSFYINRSQKNNALHAMQVLYQLSYGPMWLFRDYTKRVERFFENQ